MYKLTLGKYLLGRKSSNNIRIQEKQNDKADFSAVNFSTTTLLDHHHHHLGCTRKRTKKDYDFSVGISKIQIASFLFSIFESTVASIHLLFIPAHKQQQQQNNRQWQQYKIEIILIPSSSLGSHRLSVLWGKSTKYTIFHMNITDSIFQYLQLTFVVAATVVLGMSLSTIPIIIAIFGRRRSISSFRIFHILFVRLTTITTTVIDVVITL
ncbi:hypothetical protein T09_31 [Trichinella sp. T9]|nr:hypothetical protein T09_31 [Trichinella sp. T9]